MLFLLAQVCTPRTGDMRIVTAISVVNHEQIASVRHAEEVKPLFADLAASSNETPCTFRLAAASFASHSNLTKRVYPVR